MINAINWGSDLSCGSWIFLIKTREDGMCLQTLFSPFDYCCDANLETSTEGKSNVIAEICGSNCTGLLALWFGHRNDGCWRWRENVKRHVNDNTNDDRKRRWYSWAKTWFDQMLYLPVMFRVYVICTYFCNGSDFMMNILVSWSQADPSFF